MGLYCYITLPDESVELSNDMITVFNKICPDFIFQNTVSFRGKIIDFLIETITLETLYKSLNTNTLSNMYQKMNTFIQRDEHEINKDIRTFINNHEDVPYKCAISIEDLKMYSEIFKICSENNLHIEPC